MNIFSIPNPHEKVATTAPVQTDLFCFQQSLVRQRAYKQNAMLIMGKCNQTYLTLVDPSFFVQDGNRLMATWS